MLNTKLPLLTEEWYAQQRLNRLMEEIEENYDLFAVKAYADNNWLKLEDFQDWVDQFEDAFVGR